MQKNIIYFLILSSALFAQEIRVIDILDANLFRTKDSTLISMVNLEVPSVNDPDSNRSVIAKKAMELARLHLLRQKLRFQETYKNSCSDGLAKKGHLWRVYPLSEQSVNELYLEKGYAIYIPCDTLHMELYRNASLKSFNNNLGLWKPYTKQEKPDMFNRLRVSMLLIEEQFEEESYFPPLFGINYRWSDLVTVFDKDPFHMNFSAETGTLLYFALPYLNIGSEIRYSNFYGRIHYDAMLPIFFFINSYNLETIHYWGFDFGMIIPLGKRRGLEIEFNSKRRENFYFNYISLSFAVY